MEPVAVEPVRYLAHALRYDERIAREVRLGDDPLCFSEGMHLGLEWVSLRSWEKGCALQFYFCVCYVLLVWDHIKQ